MFRRPIKRGTCPTIILDYTDSGGETTTRTVAPIALILAEMKVTKPSKLYLHGRCSTANALRTFRFDRIEAISDQTTGEAVDIGEWLSALQLDPATPYRWDDEQPISELGFRARIKHRIAVIKARWPIIRAAAIATLVGFAIGRLRILSWLLGIFGSHKGLWL